MKQSKSRWATDVNLTICFTFVKTTIVGTIMEVLDKELIVGLLKVGAHIEEKLNAALKPYELSVPQFNVLRILRGNANQPVTLHTLQSKMIKPMSNTTRLVDKLVSKKLVTREICAQNRRKVDICITQKGLTFLTQLDQSIATAEKELLLPLSLDVRDNLYHSLQRLLSNQQ